MFLLLFVFSTSHYHRDNRYEPVKYFILPFIVLWGSLIALYAFVAGVALPGKWFGAYTGPLYLLLCLVLPVTIFLWIRAKIRLVEWRKGKERSGRILFPPFAAFLFVLHLVMVQQYIDIALSSLVEVRNASELADPGTAGRYFSVHTSYIDISRLKSSMVFRPPGRRRRREEIYVYITCPLRNSAADTSEPVVWLGVEYKKVVQLREKTMPMEMLCDQFYRECLLEFRATRGGKFVYLEDIDGDAFVREFQRGAIRSDLPPGLGDMVFRPVYKEFEFRTDDSLSWIFGFGGFAVFVIGMIPGSSLHKERFRQYVAEVKQKRKERWKALRTLFGRRGTEAQKEHSGL